MKWPVSNEKAWIQEALCLLQFLSTLLIFLSQKLAFCLLYSFIVGLFYLLVPRTTIQRRAFSIVDRSTWNGLSLEIRLLPKNNIEAAFYRLLKTDLYRRGWAGVASEKIC